MQFNLGPVEFDDLVLQQMSTQATSHVDPEFIQVKSIHFNYLIRSKIT